VNGSSIRLCWHVIVLAEAGVFLLSRLNPYIDKIIGNQQCGFRHNRSTTDQIFCIRQILEKKWKNK
jgi:hypothetical protein